ncbi:MAG: DegT/DnrJ/EryC1/StrS family aminotransferase [Deltaproteobacteria bacterium]|jgi:perosamine synthetase|nr:DegT/DnrJ/EryC1/StrS family aminotransferase [Deltaproteobacteria bacterium]
MIPIAKPFICDEEKNAVLDVLNSGMLASGKIVTKFEQNFADYLGIKYGITTSSGTTALEVALRGLGIGGNDKVITTPFSFIASTNAILYVGAIPIFADIDSSTFNITAESIAKSLDENPDAKAILIVHLFGQSCDMTAITKLAKEKELLLIEDCSQAHGAKWCEEKVGSFGDVATFSFYPTKNMTTSEGGIVVTNNLELADKLRLLINHGMKERYRHGVIGYNYRMTNIAAAIGIEQLKKLDEFNKKRQTNAQFFDKNIKNPRITLPSVEPKAFHVFHQYCIKVNNNKREQLMELLKQKEIGYSIFYPTTIPEQPCYDTLEFKGNWSIADEVKKQILSIPVHPSLTEKDLYAIVDAINSFIL